VRLLPAAVDLETANRALSLRRTTGYDRAERGRYPGTVLRLGSDIAGRPVTQGVQVALRTCDRQAGLVRCGRFLLRDADQ